MTEFKIDDTGMPVISERGRPDRQWGMQDPKLSQNLYIDAQGNLAVKGAGVSMLETLSAHPYLSPAQAAVLVTALAMASEQSLSYDSLPLPGSIEGQPEKQL